MGPMEELQRLIYAALNADTAFQGLNAGGIKGYDRVPEKPVFPYWSFGPKHGLPDDSDCIEGQELFLQLDFWSRDVGKIVAGRMVDAARRALSHGDLGLSVSGLTELRAEQWFVMDDPDGLTAHGVLSLKAMIEEH
jgi:Protein of unknown function (DUF3168)